MHRLRGAGAHMGNAGLRVPLQWRQPSVGAKRQAGGHKGSHGGCSSLDVAAVLLCSACMRRQPCEEQIHELQRGSQRKRVGQGKIRPGALQEQAGGEGVSRRSFFELRKRS